MDTSDDSRPSTDQSRPGPRQPQSCDIGPRHIPIVMEDRLGNPVEGTFRWFSGSDSGVHELREYTFWSVLAGPVPLIVVRVTDGRAIESELRDHACVTPRQTELLEKFADRVMPATAGEVGLWLKSHPADATFLVSDAPG